MDSRRRSILLLEQADWGEDSRWIKELKDWGNYPVVLKVMQTLDVDALYKSAVHGSGHINRVLILSSLIGFQEGLEEEFLRHYLLAASYHDVGRTFDGLDLDHGSRSAERLEHLTSLRGDALRQMQGAVAAHSQPDSRMEEMVCSYGPKNLDRAMELARLLKDADNLDRVRLGDFKTEFLRHESAKALAGFAHRLFRLDQMWKQQIAN